MALLGGRSLLAVASSGSSRSLSSLRFPSHRALAVSFRGSEKRRARSQCRVSGRKRLAGDSRRDGDLSTVKYREEKWAEALIFDVCLVPSTFKGVEKEEPFLRMEPDYLSRGQRPKAENFSTAQCSARTSLSSGCEIQRASSALHSARRYLYLGAGEITWECTTPSAQESAFDHLRRFPSCSPGSGASQLLAAPESLGKTWGAATGDAMLRQMRRASRARASTALQAQASRHRESASAAFFQGLADGRVVLATSVIRRRPF